MSGNTDLSLLKSPLLTVLEHAEESDDDQQVDVFHHHHFHGHWEAAASFRLKGCFHRVWCVFIPHTFYLLLCKG